MKSFNTIPRLIALGLGDAAGDVVDKMVVKAQRGFLYTRESQNQFYYVTHLFSWLGRKKSIVIKVLLCAAVMILFI